MVGEPFELYLTLKYKNLEDYTIISPKIEGVSLKEINDDEHKNANNEWVDTITYRAVFHKSGTLLLPAQKADIEFLSAAYNKLNNRYKYLQKRTAVSNTLTLEVNALPQGIEVIGDYTLQTQIKRRKTDTGEVIKFEITLQGEGNLKNLNALKLEIAGVTVYEKKSQMSKDSQKKVFEIVAQKSFTIAPIGLKYFNENRKKVEYLLSPSYKIKINESSKRSEVYWLIAVVVSIFFVFLVWKRREKQEDNRLQKLSKIKDKKIFLKKVLPYLRRERKLDRLILKLEDIEQKEFENLKREILKRLDD